MTYEAIAKFVQQGGTVYFVLLFLAALIFALRPRAKSTYERAARLPLEEDDNDVPA
jgi:cytochrome c oxidase cbb3-type subunit 4